MESKNTNTCKTCSYSEFDGTLFVCNYFEMRAGLIPRQPDYSCHLYEPIHAKSAMESLEVQNGK